jgi:hypothetical protein
MIWRRIIIGIEDEFVSAYKFEHGSSVKVRKNVFEVKEMLPERSKQQSIE